MVKFDSFRVMNTSDLQTPSFPKGFASVFRQHFASVLCYC